VSESEFRKALDECRKALDKAGLDKEGREVKRKVVDERWIKEEVILPFTVGRLLCRRFRDLLESLRFAGYNLDWHEGGGWIKHEFTVRCDRRCLFVLMGCFGIAGGKAVEL